MTKTSQRDKEEGRQEFVFKGSRKKNESENKIQENILLKFDNLFFLISRDFQHFLLPAFCYPPIGPTPWLKMSPIFIAK